MTKRKPPHKGPVNARCRVCGAYWWKLDGAYAHDESIHPGKVEFRSADREGHDAE